MTTAPPKTAKTPKPVVMLTPEQRIAACRRIVANCQNEKLEGTRIDLFTASAIVQVYDLLSDESKLKYSAFPLVKMAIIAFKMCK